VKEETRNITLAIPRDVLRKAKMIAVRRDTSVSGLLTSYLREVVDEDDEYGRAMKRQLRTMKRARKLGLTSRPTWTRDELHERKP
jgi:Family of unknown function (DUF6364)